MAADNESSNVAIEHEILEYIADPIFVKDRQHRWVTVNRAFCDLVGHDREALLGRTDHDFFPVEQADHFHAKDREVFELGLTITVEEEPITDAQGRRHILATTKVPVFTGDVVTHLVGIIHDITPLKAIEEQFRLANASLERSVEERSLALKGARDALIRKERLSVLGQLSGGVAHQLRNPLGAIRNAASVLRRRLGQAIDGEVLQALAIIDEEVFEANRIITDMLDYASIKPPMLEVVRLADVVNSAVARANPPAGLAIVIDVEAELLATIDERQTRDALANVIRNGFDAIEGVGGQGTLTVIARRDQDSVVLLIEDTGAGIADAAVAYLFEPLVTTKQLGLGLGLATAKALIENQSGSIEFEPTSAGGARFVVRLRGG